MASNRPPPPYPKKTTIALIGRRAQLKNMIGNAILSCENAFVTMSDTFVVAENSTLKVINTPGLYDEEHLHPDQQIIDLMALSQPGPDLFILAIDSENTQEENATAQISRLQYIFGEEITAHLIVVLPDVESLHRLDNLRKQFNIQLATVKDNLASECTEWCAGRRSFLYDYKNYSKEVVMRRRGVLEKRRHNGPAEAHHGIAANGPDNIFNIVLLGLSGTGKSASGNTILAFGNSKSNLAQLFTSGASSMPVTSQCEVRIMEKPFGIKVRVVDTPDFLHDQLENSQAHVEECKKYCQPGKCVVLLVLQLGRITDVEIGILEKLENKFGWSIREDTIVLLTHGEDLQGRVEQVIHTCHPLKNIVEKCGRRYHVFSNSSKSPKQVFELIKKFPNAQDLLLNVPHKNMPSECCTC